MDNQGPSSDPEVDSVDLQNPYPREIAASHKAAWSERWPWEGAPLASFALNFGFVLARKEISGPLGLASLKLLIFTVACVALILVWVIGCYVTFRNAVITFERIHQRKPWFGAALNSVLSSLASLLSAALFPLAFLGTDSDFSS